MTAFAAKQFVSQLLRTLLYALLLFIVLFFLLCVMTPPHNHDPTRGQVSVVKNDLRNLAAGLESYKADWGDYPVPGPPLSSLPGAPNSESLHPLLMALPVTLSTPLAYVTSARPVDPFSVNGQLPSAYLKDVGHFEFLLISPGPDRDFDFIPDQHLIEGEMFLDPAPIIYDSTNGTVSNGDIIRSRNGILHPIHFLRSLPL